MFFIKDPQVAMKAVLISLVGCFVLKLIYNPIAKTECEKSIRNLIEEFSKEYNYEVIVFVDKPLVTKHDYFHYCSVTFKDEKGSIDTCSLRWIPSERLHLCRTKVRWERDGLYRAHNLPHWNGESEQ